MIGGTISEKRMRGSRVTWMNSFTTICQIRPNIARTPQSRVLWRARIAAAPTTAEHALERGHVVARRKNISHHADRHRHLVDRKSEAGEQESGQEGGEQGELA